MAPATVQKPYIPTEAESQVSKESSRILASYVSDQQSTRCLKIIEEDGSEQAVVIPATAFSLLVEILSQMA